MSALTDLQVSPTEFVPPFDEDAERAVLGSLMLMPEAIDTTKITSGDFYLERHKQIYLAVRDLHRRGLPLNLITVRDELEKRKQLNGIGGGAYLSSLFEMPTALHLDGYAQIVKEKAARRMLLRHADQIAQAAGDKSLDLREVANDLQVTAESLRRDGRSNSDSWRVYTLADAYDVRDPLKFVVGGLLTLPSLSILYGAPGTLKSLLLADLAVCVAAGVAWLQALPGEDETARAVIQCPVMWADFDNGARRTHERFAALARARDLPDDIPLYYYCMPSPWLDATSTDAIGDLSERILANGARLVVIDNLGVISGTADENGAEMIQVMANLRWLSEQTGAAVIVIHHQRKGNGYLSRAGESLRGHSSIEAALDLALIIEREEHSNLLTIRSTKTRDVDVLPFSAQFTYEHKLGTHELETARFFGMPIEDTTSDRAVEAAILEAVTNHHPVNQSKLKEVVKLSLPDVGVNRIRGIADSMVNAGRLTASSGQKRSRIYDLP